MEIFLEEGAALIEIAPDEFIGFGEGFDAVGEFGVEFELAGDFLLLFETVGRGAEGGGQFAAAFEQRFDLPADAVDLIAQCDHGVEEEDEEENDSDQEQFKNEHGASLQLVNSDCKTIVFPLFSDVMS